MLAAGRNDALSVRLLLANGADARIKAANGLTAYGYAKANGGKESAALLMKAK